MANSKSSDQTGRTGTSIDMLLAKAYLTPTEVAELLKVSPITVRQWAQKGQLAAQTTPGGHRRFSVTDVREFAAARGITFETRKPRLLIVDDDEQLNRFLQALFLTEVEGLEIFTATDGFEAGLLVQEHQPDVVLLDIMMPGMDGVAVCERIKAHPAARDTRVVGMTGHYTQTLADRMHAAGAVTLLKKPFSSDEVIRECGFTRIGSSTRGVGAGK